MISRILGILTGVCLVFAACADTDEDESTNQSITWCCSLFMSFEATHTERLAIDSLLGIVASREDVDPHILDGQVERLASEAEESRYAAIILRGEPSREVVIYGMGEVVPASVGEPFLTGIEYNEYNFGVLDVLDRDGDGNPDLTYCFWGDEPGHRQSTTIGLRGSTWYPIAIPDPIPDDCGPGGSP